MPVHPHLRGDHIPVGFDYTQHSGSSPPAWGPHKSPQGPYGTPRFIPTCVGTTNRGHSRACKITVHPHLRGDHAVTSNQNDLCYGSSPPAWGPPCRPPAPEYRIRFIPTCVGTTVPNSFSQRCDPVHPHLRGDHSLSTVADRHYLRFIPTCVGTTLT